MKYPLINNLLLPLALLVTWPTSTYAWSAAAANATGDGFNLMHGDTPDESKRNALEACRSTKTPGCKLLGPPVSEEMVLFFKGSAGYGYATSGDRQIAFDRAYENCVKTTKNCKMYVVGWAGLARYGAVSAARNGGFYFSVNSQTRANAEKKVLDDCKREHPGGSCEVISDMTTDGARAYAVASPLGSTDEFLSYSWTSREHAMEEAVALCEKRMEGKAKCKAHEEVFVNHGRQEAPKGDAEWMRVLIKMRNDENRYGVRP